MPEQAPGINRYKKMETNSLNASSPIDVDGDSGRLQLKAARERMGISVADVCARLKMTPKQVQALESGDTGALPPGSYGRAFAKSYAKFLGLDPDAVTLALFGADTANVSTDYPVRQPTGAVGGSGLNISMAETRSRQPMDKGLATYSSNKNSDKRLVIAAVATLAIGLAVYLFGPFVQDRFKARMDNELVVSPGMPPPAVVEQAVTPPDTTTENAPATTADGKPSTEAVIVSPAPLSPAAPAAVAPAQPSPPPAAADTKPPVDAKPLVDPKSPTIKLSFSDRAWVTVRDRDGNVLMSQLNAAGSEKTLEGNGPFKVILGNAPAVKLEHRGKAVDLKPFIKNDVARMTLE